MAQYGKASYWDERYTKDPEPFDWYQRYSGIKDLLAQYARQHSFAIVLRCPPASRAMGVWKRVC